MASRAARRAPGSPPKEQPIATWARPSRAVVRACGAVNPGRRSAEMRLGHSGFGQEIRRTVECSRTVRPKQDKSASRRVYRVWTRRASQPHEGA